MSIPTSMSSDTRKYSLRPRKSNPVSDARRAFIESILAADSSSEDPDYVGKDDFFDVAEEVSEKKRQRDEEDPEEENSNSGSDDEDGSDGEDPGAGEESGELDADGNVKNLIDDGKINEENIEKKIEEDWVLDTALLGTVIEKKVVSKFPELESETKKLYSTIIEALAEADEGIVEKYCGAKPNDRIWKVGLPPEKIEQLEPLLNEARNAIESDTPTLLKILETEMTPVDRKKALQLLDLYNNMDPYTNEENDMRDRINSFLKAASKNVAIRIRADAEGDRIMKETESVASETMKSRIVNLRTSDAKKRRMLEVLQELNETPSGTTMYRATKEKLEWMISLPYEAVCPLEVEFGRSTAEEINAFCCKVRDKLDNDPDIGLYGMTEAKDEIIAALNNRITNPKSNVMVCLTGAPGTGKSFLASAVATAAGLPFERISLGGVTDASFILGSDAHYLGSAPGIVLKILRNMKVANGVVLLDEIDKLGSDERGLAVQAAVMHITDYTTNKDFRDKYLADYGHDISNLWFMASCNDPDRLLPPLKDRLNLIPVEKYSNADLKLIARNYVLPRVLKDIALPKELVSMDDSGASTVLTMLGNHIDLEGVRPVQKLVRMIVSRINLLRTTTLADGTTGKLHISYRIPEFKLPIVINANVVHHLVDKTKLARTSSKLNMYI